MNQFRRMVVLLYVLLSLKTLFLCNTRTIRVKKLVDENKFDCYQSALYYRNCGYCLFKHSTWTRFNFHKIMVALKGKI